MVSFFKRQKQKMLRQKVMGLFVLSTIPGNDFCFIQGKRINLF